MSSDGKQPGEPHYGDAHESESEQRKLRIQVLRAEIEQKNADTRLKIEQTKWKHYKAMSTVFGSAVAVSGALLALGAWLGRHLTAVPH